MPRSSNGLFRVIGRRSFAIRPFKLPDIGEGIAEVQVMEWFVKEGETVKEMDKLCLVESDKASVEITSRYHGIIKTIHVQANEQAKVGAVIVEIDDGEPGSETKEAPAGKEEQHSKKGSPDAGEAKRGKMEHPASKSSGSGQHGSYGEVKALPAVRGLAKQMGVDLSQIRGSGKDGRITEEDVRNSEKASKSSSEDFSAQLENYGPAKEVKLSQVGVAMVKSMNESLRVPQLTHSDELECDRLLSAIKALKPLAKDQFGLSSLTLSAFFIKALSLGMKEFPLVNSRISTDQASYHLLRNHNISVAMDSPRGLVVPNIKNVQNLSIVEIQKNLLALMERAKAGRLTFDDIKGGTVSFSNIGVIGGTYAKPVIFDGQAVIGCVGRALTLPRYNEQQQLEPRRIMNISWTADHRHIDGATVARFSNVVRRLVEHPEELLAVHFQ